MWGSRMTIRLVLADAYPVVIDGLRERFARETDIEVVATANDGIAALAAVREFEPDILVLDLSLPGLDGLSVIREMKRAGCPTLAALFIAQECEGSAGRVLEAVRLGVRGVVMKNMAAQWVLICVREVHAGRKWLEKSIALLAVENLLKREEGAQGISSVLTPREIEVARMVSKGLANKAVAGHLEISEGTAKQHLHRIYRKLRLTGRIALMQYMQNAGLL